MNKLTKQLSRGMMKDVLIVKEVALAFVTPFFSSKIDKSVNPAAVIMDSHYAIFVGFIKATVNLTFIL
jgi:hypothetical protein